MTLEQVRDRQAQMEPGRAQQLRDQCLAAGGHLWAKTESNEPQEYCYQCFYCPFLDPGSLLERLGAMPIVHRCPLCQQPMTLVEDEHQKAALEAPLPSFSAPAADFYVCDTHGAWCLSREDRTFARVSPTR
jgi:hypothetical protein